MSAAVETVRRHAGAALAALDGVTGDGSPESAGKYGDAIVHLVRLRDGLIGDHRAHTDARRWLDRTNVLLSLGFGIEYPINGFRWQRVCELREAVRDLMNALRKAA